MATVAFGLTVFTVAAERRAADREYAAYETLCSMGATGDDWVSFREFITGRPPVVQVEIPSAIPPDVAFDLLPDLHHLEALTLAYPSLTVDQLNAVADLDLDYLQFTGDFPSDFDVARLSCLRNVRFLDLTATNLSADAKAQLRSLLPSSKIEFE